jgi:hypothetical protein
MAAGTWVLSARQRSRATATETGPYRAGVLPHRRLAYCTVAISPKQIFQQPGHSSPLSMPAALLNPHPNLSLLSYSYPVRSVRPSSPSMYNPPRPQTAPAKSVIPNAPMSALQLLGNPLISDRTCRAFAFEVRASHTCIRVNVCDARDRAYQSSSGGIVPEHIAKGEAETCKREVSVGSFRASQAR